MRAWAALVLNGVLLVAAVTAGAEETATARVAREAVAEAKLAAGEQGSEEQTEPETLRFVPFPADPLWQPAVAAQREPRIAVKVSNFEERTSDVAIGGTFPIARLARPSRPQEGLELDLAVAVFTRFDSSYALTVADYLVEVPVTWACDRWVWRAALSHTSSHLGDDYLKGTGGVTSTVERDEVTFATAYELSPRLRVSARAAVIYGSKGMPSGRERLGVALEWQPVVDGPFAALDLDERAWHDWTPGVTLRAGWQWRSESGRVCRLAAEGYNGRSPFDQLSAKREKWFAVTFDLDW